MAYEYRRLTPEERARVTRARIARGYPAHAPPHLYRDAGRYLVTSATFEHAPIITQIDRRTDFEARLLAALQTIDADVYAWVILPNHYHVMLGVTDLQLVSEALRRLHGATAREWNLRDGEVGRRRVWYRFADRVLRGDPQFYSTLNYIHFNPVKHGYVEDPYEWPWSSLESYCESRGREWLREMWRVHPPAKMGAGWDE